MLQKVRAEQPFNGSASEMLRIPSLLEFADWIFQAADMSNEYSDGRAIAYGCMCRMMCRKQDDYLPDNYLSQFYRIIIKVRKPVFFMHMNYI